MKPRRWSIVRRIGFLASVAVFGVIGAAAWFFMSHRTATTTSPQLAEIEFLELRARFSSEQPLVDMARREPSDLRSRPAGLLPLRSFHTVVFDTRGGQRLVRIAVPYWFARRFAGRDHEFVWLGQLTFLDDTEFDPEPIRLSLDELERHGPGLVVDYRHPGGGQFISWVE